MKTKIFTIFSAATWIAVSAIAQGSGAAAGGGSAASGAATGGLKPVAPPTGAPVPTDAGNISPVNPSRFPNGNTPVVGGGLGANNLGFGTNNITLGTNAVGLIGSNQFSIRSNNLSNLSPTGRTNGASVTLTNGNAVLIGSGPNGGATFVTPNQPNVIFVNPENGNNAILINPK